MKIANVRRASAKRWYAIKSALRRKWSQMGGFSPPLFWLFIFVLLGLLAYFAYDYFWLCNQSELEKGIYIEFYGLIFDVIFIGLLFGLYDYVRVRRLEVQRQREIIDDFKKWDNEEGRLRIAGAIRRLNGFGKTDIDFGGIELSDFSFRYQDIKSIAGSTFYDGTWGEGGSREKVSLVEVDFWGIDCRKVVFSKFNPFGGMSADVAFMRFVDCTFSDANLTDACFRGASLIWSKRPPATLGEWVEIPGEQPIFHPTHTPCFSHATLTGVSFADVQFEDADFRESINILSCDFEGAKDLNTCVFDPGVREQLQKRYPESFGLPAEAPEIGAAPVATSETARRYLVSWSKDLTGKKPSSSKIETTARS